MYNQNGMYSGYEVETNKEVETKTSKMYEGSYTSMPSTCGMMMPPVYECPKERVIHREFVHEVPHICPVNTRIVNHHIYKHTYSPCYTCCEENEVCNISDCCGNNF